MTATSSEGTESNSATVNQNTQSEAQLECKSKKSELEEKKHTVVEASFRIQQKKTSNTTPGKR
jgi:hypothetical protein